MPRTKLGPARAMLLICATVLSATGGFALVAPVAARTVTWVRAADALTIDPHAVDEGVALTLNQQIYEPLMLRDAQGKTVGGLAESWSLTADPLVWEFRLRRNVTFHDGNPFTADDVIFSINRARGPHSGFKGMLAAVEQVSAPDSHTVRIKTRGPTPLMPANLTHVLMMSKVWAEKNGAAQVADRAQITRAHTFRNANGTGPFVLVSREVGARTVMRRNEGYWGQAQSPVDISELIYRPIPNDTERVQALLSGEADLLQDVPVNEMPRLQANKALTISIGPENRSVFLGLNVGSAGPSEIGTEARSPLSDKRVREMMSAAINRQVIQRNVLLGQAIPTGAIAPSSVNGYPRQLDRIPAVDPARIKAVLAEAGWPNGFRLKLDCPREGVVRGEALCRNIAQQLTQSGITVEPVIRDQAAHLEVLRRMPGETDLFLHSVNIPSFDSEQMLLDLFHSRTPSAGRGNYTRYANPVLDKLIAELSGQIDFSARSQAMAAAWQIAQDEMIYIPLFIQTVAYAMKADLTVQPDIENQPKLRFARVKSSIQ